MDRPGIHITHETLEAWTGMELSQEQVNAIHSHFAGSADRTADEWRPAPPAPEHTAAVRFLIEVWEGWKADPILGTLVPLGVLLFLGLLATPLWAYLGWLHS